MVTTGAGLIFLFILHYAIAVQSSGILSSLYQKANEEDRPLVLVIDKNNKDDDHSKHHEHAQMKYNPLAKKPSNYVGNTKTSNPWNLLHHLGQKHYHLNDQHKHSFSHSHELSSYRLGNPSRSRLRSSPDRDDRDDQRDRDRSDRRNDRDRRFGFRSNRDRRDRIRDSRERSYRYSLERRDSDRDRRDRIDSDRRDRDLSDRHDRDDYDRRDRYRSDSDRRDRDRDSDRRERDKDSSDDSYRSYRGKYDSDRSYRDRYDSDRNRDNDRKRYFRNRSVDNNDRSLDRTLRALIKDTLQEKQPKEKEDHDPSIQALRASVIKNILRAANDINCDAQDECEDECSEKRKVDQCEDSCKKVFTCEKEVESSCDECDQRDECADESDDCGKDDKNPSTRGILYEEPNNEGRKRRRRKTRM